MAINASTPTRVKTSSITNPTPDPDNHTLVLGQVKESIEVGQRLRGDPNDSFVRVSEINSALGTRMVNGTLQPPNSTASGSVSVSVINSIMGNGTGVSPLQLVGDSAAPGNNMVYGTNGSGVKGWYTAGGGGGSLTVTDGTTSVASTTNLRFNGAIVSGTTPNAIVTITGGGGGGTPSTINDLVFWWKSDTAVASITTGNHVVALQNSCPWMASFSPTALSLGATVSASLLNSLPVCTFPGSTNSAYLFPGLGTANGPVLPQFTGFVVYKPVNITSTQTFVNGTAASSLGFYMTNTGFPSLVDTGVIIIGTATTGFVAGTWAQVNATYNSTSGVFAFRIARAAAGSGTNARSITGATGAVGGDNSGGSPLNGDLAEIVVYNRVLSPTEITTVEAYLHTKWGV